MKIKWIAFAMALLLLLSGCKAKSSGAVSMDELFEKTPAAMEEGHIFFAGKVTAASAANKTISFYDAEAEKNTFYKVEVTEDFFGCMPQREITVCILGATDTFNERIPLQKGKEYFFETSVWVQEDEVVFLLPTFYESMPERSGEKLYWTDGEGIKTVDGSPADYIARLKALATEQGYGAEVVLTAMKERIQSAKERNVTYFEELKFEHLDKECVEKTNQTAAALLQRVEQAEKTWESIGGLLK